MDLIFNSFRAIYRLLPGQFRELPILRRVANGIVSKALSHDSIYNESYQDILEDQAAKSAPIMARSIVKRFSPNRVVDVGCGTGALLAALRDCGCTCLGFEYAEAGIKRCKSRGLDVRKFNIEAESLDAGVGKFDVAISTEVAEHLPAACADRFVDVLTSLSSNVVFTAATPNQGGRDHVNEQPHSYWIEKFRARGYQLDEHSSESWRQLWMSEGIAHFYFSNLMIFSGPSKSSPS